MIFAEVWEGHLEASSWLLWAPWRPSGGLLEASWGPLEAFWGPLGGILGPPGALLGASWGPFEGFGGRLEVKHNFGGLAFFGRAVMELSWGRFLIFFRPFLNQF